MCIRDRQCTCLKDLLKQEASRKLNSLTPMKLCTFDSCKLDYYPDNSNENGMSPRERMRSIYNYCKKYADEFSLDSPSIIMQGATGLSLIHILKICLKARPLKIQAWLLIFVN